MGKHKDGSADFGPFDDDYRGFDIRDDETARGPLIMALALGVLIVFGAVVWNTYRQGVRPGVNSVPTVIASADSYKRAPDERGGKVQSGTDKRFYDQMDASKREDSLASPINRAPEGDELAGGSDVLQGGPPIELRPGQTDSGADPQNGMPNAIAEQVRALAELDDRTAPAEDGFETASLRPIETPLNRQTKPKVGPMFAFDDDGKFLVQIAAFRSEEAAESAWALAVKKSPDIYTGAPKRIQRADLGAKGIFYRLRVGGFAERGEASTFCSAIKSVGDNCIVVSG